MQKSFLIIGTYNHLPEGCSDLELETVYQYCYRPFLSVLNRFPDIQATLFYSGSLLRRLEAKHPEYLMLLEEMSARRQIELLGGGFYAPVLPLIPGTDRLGQIELLTTYLRKSFGKRPRGCWLSEYAWEPWLASTLQTCGMDYAFLSRSQFAASMGDGAAMAPVVTEDQGRCVVIVPAWDCCADFPSPRGFDEAWRDIDPSPGTELVTIMTRGEAIRELWERSGLESPDLYMELSLAALRKLALEVETTTPSRFLKARRPTARAYFPGSANPDFMRAAAGPVPGRSASLRNAILRYAASSALYSRMHYVHILIGQLRGDRSRKKTAAEDLWKGQCADAYWLSPRDGIMEPRVRRAAFGSLIDAERTTRLKGAFKPGIIRADLDFDGMKEILFQGTDLNAFLHLRGAALFELDALRARKNLCDLFNGEPDGDRCQRSSFVDRVYPEDPLVPNAFEPWLGDSGALSRGVYDEIQGEALPGGAAFTRDFILERGGNAHVLSVRKEYAFNRKSVHVRWTFRSRAAQRVEFWYGAEFNLAVLDADLESISADGVPLEGMDAGGHGWFRAETASRLAFKGGDRADSLSLALGKPAALSLSPVTAASASGGEIRQGWSALAVWRLCLEPDGEWSTEATLSLYD